jgi:NAD(P)-dependent dehydrogenase (short-subunit alcohol dehydrogenase family)
VRLELHGTGVNAVTVHPGGVRTPITRSGRVRAEVLGREDAEALHRDFETVARTSPERAAELIHRGVARGRARVLVSADAPVAYALAHAMPTRCFSLVRPGMRLAPRALELARRAGL